jgi:hypothetical protein
MIADFSGQISTLESRLNDSTISDNEKEDIRNRITELTTEKQDFMNANHGAQNEISKKYIGSNISEY